MLNEEIQRDLKQQQSMKNTDTRNKHLAFIWSMLPRVVEVTQIYGTRPNETICDVGASSFQGMALQWRNSPLIQVCASRGEKQ